MLNWLLIISITLVSTSMLIFVSTYIAILPQTIQYYNKDRTDILLLSNSFNILYLILSPFIFSILKKKYSLLVNISVILTAIGCTGRYLCGNDYNIALIMSSIVAIGHIPIITAPYGLLQLFPQSKRGYAASIPLFVPTLGINFSILYGIIYITNGKDELTSLSKNKQIQNLNFITALLGATSCFLTLVFMFKLKTQIKKINEQSSKTIQEKRKCFFVIKFRQQIIGSKHFILFILSWGSILGINWTYGGMFGVFLTSTGLNNKDIALIGLFANLSSAFFSNLGNWISNFCRFKIRNIIISLIIAGLFASIFIQVSSTIQNSSLLSNKYALIIAIIILRTGFSSFVSLALLQLRHCGSQVLISALFFYIANGSNLVGNLIIDLLSNSVSLGILSVSIFVCILIVQKTYDNLPQILNTQITNFQKPNHLYIEMQNDTINQSNQQFQINKKSPQKQKKCQQRQIK